MVHRQPHQQARGQQCVLCRSWWWDSTFRERFTSKVILSPKSRIHIEYLKGPLKNLKNNWEFKPAPDGGCIIDFSVEFEFGNVALQALANMFFNEVVKRMVGAFEARAEKLYGKR